MHANTSINGNDLEALQTELKSITKRIENLESIAASEGSARASYSDIELDEEDTIKKIMKT